jgi:hypothetical protein
MSPYRRATPPDSSVATRVPVADVPAAATCVGRPPYDSDDLVLLEELVDHPVDRLAVDVHRRVELVICSVVSSLLSPPKSVS